MEKWMIYAKKAQFNEIGLKYNIDPVIARIIRNRDVITDEEIDFYLNSGIEKLHDPHKLKDIDMAADIIRDKIAARAKMRIVGDYDIDGINSIYILYNGLKQIGADVDYEIPDRIIDGYGINENIIDRAYEDKIDTIITCDNGIAAIDQINHAKDLGMTVIVTDHHDIPYEEVDGIRQYRRSRADAIVNPKQIEDTYPFKMLCGATVAYKLIEVLHERYNIDREITQKYIEYAAIATIGDVVDLRDENRAIVKDGLKRLRNTDNVGLKALIDMNNLEPALISSYHIGFVIGPCLNASGRLDTAKRALSMMLADNTDDAAKTAGDLKSLNDSRKDMTSKGVDRAVEIVENTSANNRVLVIFLEDCHESIAGIIAGRIKEKYNRPVFVITRTTEGAKGSGRSIEGYNMYEELVKCSHLLTKFGGHPLAAGISLRIEDIDALREELNNNCTLTEDDMVKKVWIDVPMPLSYINERLIEQLEILEPFGKGNEKPTFAAKDVKVVSYNIIGKNKNVAKMKVMTDNGMYMDALYFGNAEEMTSYIEDKYGIGIIDTINKGKDIIKMSFCYYPSVNEYNGRRSIQIVVKNYQ